MTLELKFEPPAAFSPTNYISLFYINTCLTKSNELRRVEPIKFNTCREYFVMHYRRAINDFGPFTPWARKAYALLSCGKCFAEAYDLRHKNFLRQARKSLKFVNSFEKQAKWQRTKLYTVESKNTPMVFFVGPHRWTMSPYLMSIWSLAIRVGRNGFVSDDVLAKPHKTMVERINRSARLQSEKNDDARQISSTIAFWDLFLSSYKELFGGKKRKYHWSTEVFKGATGYINARAEGIQRLTNGGSAAVGLRKKWRKILEENS